MKKATLKHTTCSKMNSIVNEARKTREISVSYETFKMGALIQEPRLKKALLKNNPRKSMVQQNHMFLKLKTTLRKFEFPLYKKCLVGVWRTPLTIHQILNGNKADRHR